ncbi:MAG: DUF1667 domain-containing protein [Oscillospiraceae bacterium]|jgi:CxxC motif-containing protein|nr:DUF1667 domain-containing protein [Oscillospiraceae bacterium]
MIREMICITCPTGCKLTVDLNGETLKVSGNACKRGEAFALAEMTCPTRSLTTTLRTVFPEAPALPVRTKSEIPKASVMPAMRYLASIVVQERLRCGDVAAVLPDCGVEMIASSDLLIESE